jgi:hypothetical protein
MAWMSSLQQVRSDLSHAWRWADARTGKVNAPHH